MTKAKSATISNPHAGAPTRPEPIIPGWIRWVTVVALCVVTVLVYWRAGGFGFVNLDDDGYVEFAPMVNKGLRMASVVWAFTAIHTANWHPFTSLSFMLDCELFGLNPVAMHWENIFWHVANSLLVLWVGVRCMGGWWRSSLVAALFALHPLHVESVAWISSRKDLLSTFFWLWGLLAYLAWVQRPSVGRYLLICLSLVSALLFKPMAVTFPLTLLLLDFWPLRRLSRKTFWPRLREKGVLFALVFAHAVITFLVQSAAGAADYGHRIEWPARLANAVVSCWRYLAKTGWPTDFSPLYWHPGYWPNVVVAGSLLWVVLLGFAAWSSRHARPWITFGLAWFAITLVPVLGFVQVGAQSMADRYTYVPLLGVFWLVAWLLSDAVARWRWLLRPIVGVMVLFLGILAWLSHRQSLAWRTSRTLYEHSIAAGEDNPAIRYLLGTALAAEGRPESEVVAQYRRAVELAPDYINAHTQLAVIALRNQQFDEARRILEQNVRFEPRNSALRGNLGSFWSIQGDQARAETEFKAALALQPRNAAVNRELALLYLAQKRPEDAERHLRVAVTVDPWNTLNLVDLAILAANRGVVGEPERLLQRALWIDPTNEAARQNLALIENNRRVLNHLGK